jgi:hypothetical protein
MTTFTIELQPAQRDAIKALGGSAYLGVIDRAGKQRRATSVFRTPEAAEKALAEMNRTPHSVMDVFMVDEHGNCTRVDRGQENAAGHFALVRIGRGGRELHVEMPDGRALCEHQPDGSVRPYLRQGTDPRPGHRFEGGPVSEAFSTGMTGEPTCSDCRALIERGAAP